MHRAITILALCATVSACADGSSSGDDGAVIDAHTLVALRDEPCGTAGAVAGEEGRRALTAAGHHWDRLAFDGREGARAIALARKAGTCFAAAGLRDARRAAEAFVLQSEQALYLAVQAERRAFARARARGQSAEASFHALRLLSLLEEDNPASASLRRQVARWQHKYESTRTQGGRS